MVGAPADRDDSPFAVIYRWTVDPQAETAFIARWREATIELKKRHGAQGSCLARDEMGRFVAFARWPNEEARRRAFDERAASAPLPGVRNFEQIPLRVVEDLLSHRD